MKIYTCIYSLDLTSPLVTVHPVVYVMQPKKSKT